MSNKMKDLNIAVVMFDGGEEQDIVGCWEMFSWATEYDDLPEDEEVTEASFCLHLQPGWRRRPVAAKSLHGGAHNFSDDHVIWNEVYR